MKDRALLDENLGRLTSSGGQGDAFNGRNLSALAVYFDKSYADAMADKLCWVAPSDIP